MSIYDRPDYLRLVHSTPRQSSVCDSPTIHDESKMFYHDDPVSFQEFAASLISVSLFIMYLPFLVLSVFGFTGILALIIIL